MVNDPSERHWFVLYTKPRHEFKAELQLKSISIENYLPTYLVTKRWSDRKKKINEPLFRGYIFIYASEKERFLALSQLAIVRCISFSGKPSIVPEWQINNLKKILSESPEVIVSNKIEIGTSIKITDGPFKDVIGVVTGTQEDKWLAVSIDLIHRSVIVRLPKESGIQVHSPLNKSQY